VNTTVTGMLPSVVMKDVPDHKPTCTYGKFGSTLPRIKRVFCQSHMVWTWELRGPLNQVNNSCVCVHTF
jgi:hypothetical protein